MQMCIRDRYYSTYFNANKAFGALNNMTLANYDPDDPDNPTNSYALQLTKNWTKADMLTSLSYAIAAGTKHPDEAFKVFEELYTNPEICTLLKYGIEGQDYQLNKDGKVEFLDGQDVTNCSWSVGWTSSWALPNWEPGPPSSHSACFTILSWICSPVICRVLPLSCNMKLVVGKNS